MSVVLYRYAILAYSPHPEEDAAFPLAVMCVPSQPESDCGAMFVVDGWVHAVNASHRSYIEETLREWKDCMQDSLESTFLQVTDLSIGPVRTLKTGECDEQELRSLYNVLLSPSPLRIA